MRWYEAAEFHDRWTVLNELMSFEEPERRSWLRPHEDLETCKADVALFRQRLDDALDALTQFELKHQLGTSGVLEDAQGEDLLPAMEAWKVLLISDSFLRYLNTYLYFGVRILLRRCFSPEAIPFVDGEQQINRQPWWLEVPPRLQVPKEATDRIHPGPDDSEEIKTALRFLDGTVAAELQANCENRNVYETLELWIRDLRPDLKGLAGEALEKIALGLELWAKRQAAYYFSLTGQAKTPLTTLPVRPQMGWGCNTPVIARVALGDLYWIAGILRTDVNAEAKVTGRVVSWLGLLRFRVAEKGEVKLQQELQSTEEVLRQVFGVCCDLIQNASDLALLTQLRDAEQALGTDGSARNVKAQKDPPEGWRAVFDAELDEVRQQREYRNYEYDSKPGLPGITVAAPVEGWSKRLTESEAVPDLIGIAMSGGGIRSATFNIGVLQGLQELDLLRQVDYISTVSGGGFAGSWLMANVKRSTYWLGRLTPWERSIRHLREYSNYLAPKTGILSMDTWSLGSLWLRNTLFIQLTAMAWLLTLFTGVYLERLGFLALVSRADHILTRLFVLLCALISVASLTSSLMLLKGLPLQRRFLLSLGLFSKRLGANKLAARSFAAVRYALRLPVRRGWQLEKKYVLSLGMLPAWLGATVLAARIFAVALADKVNVPPDWLCRTLRIADLCRKVKVSGNVHYSQILKTLPLDWRWMLVLTFTFVGLLIVCAVSLLTSKTRLRGKAGTARRWGGAVGIALISTGVVHLCLCALIFAVRVVPEHLQHDMRVSFLVFTLGPSLVLLTYTLSIFLLIGLAGRASDGTQREWWTRYGAWVLISAGLAIALSAIVFGSPWLFHWLFTMQKHKGLIRWGAVASWVGTSLGGLLAGRSSRTAGEGATRSPSLQTVASIGGAVFLAGACMGAAELLYAFLHAYNSPLPGYGTLGYEAAAGTGLLTWTLVVLFLCSLLFSYRFDLNVFGLSELYKNRLVRCYLGATRWQPGRRDPEPFTQFDFNDDLKLSKLAGNGFRGPFPIVNCSMNLSGSADLTLHTRHSASFTLTPLHCGASRQYVGYRKTACFAGDMLLGQAVAVSGAAASPNMGYNTAPMVALLLTLFNVRLGWWFPNPGSEQTTNRGPRGLRYLLTELLGLASERRKYVNVTDGGHFENLGIYELVRRRCQLIIACDAECDETMTFTGLANAIRLCYTDFGAVIDLDLASLRRGETGLTRAHSAVGAIRYSNGSVGRIIYIKASITGDEDATVTQYLSGHPTFPHETTANQFFKEEQFESYRRLGQHIVRNALRSAAPRDSLIRISERLMDTMTPAASTTEKFLQHTQALEQVWRHLREQHPLQLQRNGFLQELMGHAAPPIPRLNADITCIGLELLQLMENIFIDLRLDDFWEHPDHRGWALLFMNWARSPRFRMVWQQNHHTFGIRFEHFCASRLGLIKDEPVLRVSPLTRD